MSYSNPIVNMEHMEHVLHDLLFYCTKGVLETRSLLLLLSRGWNLPSGAWSGLENIYMVGNKHWFVIQKVIEIDEKKDYVHFS